jgi:hypothetical protein
MYGHLKRDSAYRKLSRIDVNDRRSDGKQGFVFSKVGYSESGRHDDHAQRLYRKI